MRDVTIFHNPRCSKSRQALALLEEAGITPTIRVYLEDVPQSDEIKELLAKLDMPCAAVLRKGEDAYKAHFKGVVEEDALIQLLEAHPKVLERPIIIKGDKAVIGRPPEALLPLIK